jgi:hypothetical protein
MVEVAMSKLQRTVMRSPKGVKFYAKHDSKGRFKDIVAYKKDYAKNMAKAKRKK